MFQKDSNVHGGGILFYVNQYLSCRVLNKLTMYQNLEVHFLELKVSKANWLIIGTYKPP